MESAVAASVDKGVVSGIEQAAAKESDLPERIATMQRCCLASCLQRLPYPLPPSYRSRNFLYQAVVQDGQRRYEEFKKNYGDSEESSHLYQQGQKAADDWYNGFTPWD